MTSLLLKKPILGAEAWTGAELNARGYLRFLSPRLLAALQGALEHVKARGLRAPGFGKADFPLHGVEDELSTYVAELQHGQGFLALRGLPAERYSEDEMAIVYYGLGLHMGIPVTQNEGGELIAEVINVGDKGDRKTRVYQTNAYLPYHSDLSDVVGLLSLRKAKEGGASSLISVAAIYNRILRDYPEYLALFYKPFYFAHLGEALPSLSPIFSYNAGKLSCRYMRQYIELGHDLRGLPLSRIEMEALDLFDSILAEPDLRLDMLLEAGDIQFANNYAVLHSRTGFEDHETPHERRKLLRLWLKMAEPRELAPDFPGRNGIAARVAVPA
jgi:hypothetical protein